MKNPIFASIPIASLSIAMTVYPSQAGLLDAVSSVVESVVSVQGGEASSDSAINVGLGNGGDSGNNNVLDVSFGGSSSQSGNSGGSVQVTSSGSSGAATASISTGGSQPGNITASALTNDSVANVTARTQNTNAVVEVLSRENLARIAVNTPIIDAKVVVGTPVTNVTVNIPGTTPIPGVNTNNIKLGRLLPTDTVLTVPNPTNPKRTVTLGKNDLANLVVQCGGVDPRRMTQMFDRSAPSQWGNARSADVVSVSTCEIGQAIVANHLNSHDRYSNFLDSLGDYPHIVSALQGNNRKPGDVFAVTKSGNSLKIYVY